MMGPAPCYMLIDMWNMGWLTGAVNGVGGSWKTLTGAYVFQCKHWSFEATPLASSISTNQWNLDEIKQYKNTQISLAKWYPTPKVSECHPKQSFIQCACCFSLCDTSSQVMSDLNVFFPKTPPKTTGLEIEKKIFWQLFLNSIHWYFNACIHQSHQQICINTHTF